MRFGAQIMDATGRFRFSAAESPVPRTYSITTGSCSPAGRLGDFFLGGMQLYEQRPDKEYSLTDCISMNAMRRESVNKIPTM